MPIIRVRPIVAQSEPFTTTISGQTEPIVPQTIVVGGIFATRHQQFVDQVRSFDHCFKATEVFGYNTEELYDHLLVALQDNLIIQDGDRYCSGQVAYEMKAKTQGYVYKSGIKPQTYGFRPVI